MDERERPSTRGEQPAPEGLGNPFALGGDPDGTVTLDYGVHHEDLPLAGRTVGEIRRIVRARYDVDPLARAMVEGQFAGNDTVVRAGQSLRFMNHAGEKGQNESPRSEELFPGFSGSLIREALEMRVRRRRPTIPKVTIEGQEVTTTSPEGHTATMPLEALLTHLGRNGPSTLDASDLLLPDGVKWITSRRGHTVFVHQTPPAVHNLKWIAPDSPAKHGPETTYRQVRIALPYVIVLAFFEPRRDGLLKLGDRNECFFRNEPLRSPDDRLLYPALLNCSKFESSTKPLSWICTQHLARTRVPTGTGNNERVRRGIQDLMQCMLGTGFNYSSEHHEIASWFTESMQVDRRVSTVERWEQATREDPAFASGVPWLEVGRSVREVAERALRLQVGRDVRSRSSRDVARVLYNHGAVKKANNEDEESES